MIELVNDDLKEKVADKSKVFVLYGASWCGNCRIVKPKVKREAEKHSDVEFIYVDAEKFPESRQMANVNNLPTYATFHNGELLAQGQGNKWEAIQGVIDEVANN